MATRLKLQYLGVEWRLERRGMEWRLGGKSDREQRTRRRQAYVGSTWMWKEMGMKEEWDTSRECNGSKWALKRKRKSARERERERDGIVREYRGMLLEREGFDGNKLRS